jgi:hypothetical protein
MQGFEGYAGTRLWEGQMVNDLIFSLLLALLIVFALIFHVNYRLFAKMIRDVFHIKDRLSLFEDIDGNETVFHSFMVFQALFLCSLTFFISGRAYGYISDYPTISSNLQIIALIFIVLLSFYLFKQLMNGLLGMVFADAEQYKTWRIGYSASISSWGVLLYVPVLWMAFIGTQLGIPVFMFAVLFLLWRLVIIYKTIRIFNIKNAGLINIILYLCGQEILPLIFLYEGIIYLYNYY